MRTGSRSAAGRPADLAERLTIWSIWLLVLAGIGSEVLGQTLLFGFGFYSFHIVDPPVVVAAIAAMLHIANRRFSLTVYAVAGAVIATLIIAAFLRGFSRDPAAALLAIRANGGVATVLLMAVTMKPTPAVLAAIKRSLVLAAAVLGLLLLLRLFYGPQLFMTADVAVSDVNDGGRPLSVFGVFLMVLAEGILISDLLRSGRITLNWRAGLALAIPLAIVLSGQGTALLSGLAVIAFILVVERGPFRGLRIVLGMLAFPYAFIVIRLNLAMLRYNALVEHRFDNLNTRRMVWESLTALWPNLPMTIQLFGYPAGQKPDLFVYTNGRYNDWASSMHSMYYGSLPMMGYVGLIAYVALLAALAWSLLRAMSRRTGSVSIPAYPLAACVGIAVLSYSYEIRGSALLGLVIPIWWVRALPWLRRRSAVLSRIAIARSGAAPPLRPVDTTA